jgi:hypothetical protein
VSQLDVSGLSPSDCVAALRSFPRRYRALLALGEDDDDAVLHRPGPDGLSALEQTDAAGRDLAVVADAVRRTLVEDGPVLHPAVLDPGARQYAHGIEQPAEAALDLVVLEAERLAELTEHVPAVDWGRTAEVVGDGTVTAVDLLREAVRTTAEHLHAAERARATPTGGSEG